MFNSYAANLIKDGLLEKGNFLRLIGGITKNPLAGPLKATVDITNRCDMGCVMCWYHSPHLLRKPAPYDMPLPALERVFVQLRRLRAKTVLLCGEGEPLLHPHILEIVSSAHKNKLNIEIMTNGLYLDTRMASFFAGKRVTKIILSLHSADAESFCKIRPQRDRSDFEKIIRNAARFHKANKACRLYITNVISSLNYKDMPKMLKLAEELKADKILFKPLSLPSPLPSFLGLGEKEKTEIMRRLKELKPKIPNNIKSYTRAARRPGGRPAKNPAAGKRAFFFCSLPYINSVISLKGDVFGCAYAAKHPLGNILRQDFLDIWRGKEYQQFRRGTYCPQRCLGKAVYPLSL